jgi:xanthosine utilization system XapX-like protein
MQNIMKKTAAGALMGGSLLFTGMGVAQAAPPIVTQDGLVNLNIGDVTVLQDVEVAVVAQVVAQVCDIDVDAAVLGEVNSTGEPQTVCTIQDLGPITVRQNGPGNSEQAPGAANRPAR